MGTPLTLGVPPTSAGPREGTRGSASQSEEQRSGALLERVAELARIDELLEAARGGSGAALIVEGPAGLGKSRLLAAAQAGAEAAGFGILGARGGELEQSFPFGVVRQLLEPRLVALADDERDVVLSGAASLAAPLLSVSDYANAAVAPGGADPSFTALHGLYWMAANLAAITPLLIAVDDVHWADAASLRWLLYVLRRLASVPILIVATARPDEPDVEAELLSVIRSDPLASVIQPQALSAAATAKLVRLSIAGDVDEDFAAACHGVTAGNPLLLRELLAAAASESIPASRAGAALVRELAPEGVTRSVLLRLARLPGGAPELARAIATLGVETELRHAALLAELDEAAAARAADALVAADILEPGRPLAFIHPVVRTAIYADGGEATRRRDHARAARVLAKEGRPADEVAAHLLLSEPVSDLWAVDILREAAGLALASGAPAAAAIHLRRALGEPPPAEQRGAIVGELGLAEALGGEATAVEHIGEALVSTSEPLARAGISSVLGRVLLRLGRGAEAIPVLEAALAELGNSDREAKLRLEADLNLAARIATPPRPELAARLARLGEGIDDETAGERLLLAHRASETYFAGNPATEAIDLAERALAGGRLLAEEGPESPTFHLAVNVLALTDRFEQAERAWDEALTRAATAGSVIGFSITSGFRSRSCLFRGSIAEAEADAGEGLGDLMLEYARAVLVETAIERGDLEAAAAALAESGLPEEVPESLMVQPLLYARGRLRIASGELERGLADLLLCARRLEHWGIDAPWAVPARASAAIALASTGEDEVAERLVDQELTLARRFGASRGLGVALRAAGLVHGGERGAGFLAEAVSTLDGSGARLEHARALTDLGAALRRSGQRRESRKHLRQGADLAYRCGASALAERAKEELLASGARPRGLVLSGVEALTPSELRVARLAAEGLTNREIAQSLFVTARTVEVHLTHAYQKLEISSRRELAEALATETAAQSS